MYGIGTINTPGQRLIDPRMRLSNALMASSVQRRPDTHWMQGLGRMAQALAGTYLSNLSAQDQQAANVAMMTGLSPETVSHEPVANPQIPELESEAQTALGAAQDHMNQFGGVDNQGLGFSMVQDAQNLMRRAGELPETIAPEPTTRAGSMSRAMQMLRALPDNVYAQNMFQQLAQQKMLQDREQKLYERGRSDSLSDYERNLSDKREDTVDARNFQREVLEGDREYNLNLAKNKRLYDYLLLKDKRAYDQEIAELQRQGKMEDAKALIDYKNANPAPRTPVPGVDIPKSAAVFQQDLAKAQAMSGLKPMTEGQSKAATYADRMQAAEKIINANEQAGLSVKDNVVSGLPGGNFMVSDEFRLLEQAQRDFINAVLRKESGAVISDSEFDNARRQYFPQPGDDPATLRRKRENREIATNAISRGAGPQYTAPVDNDPLGIR